jgi:hypothetical protein
MSSFVSRRRSAVVLATGVGAIAIAASAMLPTTASATTYSMRVTGPISNLMNANFNEAISGVSSSPANYVVAWEQFYKRTGCATTFAQESTRAFFSSTWGLTAWLAQPVRAGGYTAVARFGARNLGTHGMCAYLINLSTGATYAHSSIWWTNHN